MSGNDKAVARPAILKFPTASPVRPFRLLFGIYVYMQAQPDPEQEGEGCGSGTGGGGGGGRAAEIAAPEETYRNGLQLSHSKARRNTKKSVVP